MTSSQKFNFNDVRWAYAQSQEHGSNQAPLKVGIASVSVHCKKCGHVWRAGSSGPSRLRPTVEGVIVKCPECSVDEHVLQSLFEA